MSRRTTITAAVADRIRTAESPLFLTSDFADLGSRRQVLRGLERAIENEQIARLSKGMYGRLAESRLNPGKIVLEEGLRSLALRYARRIGAEVRLTKEERDNHEGRSTQIPVGRVIGIDRRISRTLKFNNHGWGVWFETVS